MIFTHILQALFCLSAIKELHHLIEKASRWHIVKKIGHVANWLTRCAIDGKAQFSSDANCTHHAHGIFAIALFGIANHS